ncbi:ABC transporter permease [Candidatus Endoriftia persephone]|jgi:putative ABC transport system permease protein|uniref:ABC-type peptide transport system, involved in lipoprotein release, permease component n=3 Tax=Gammaproteobacteria TaxID=1236 RepID=G2FBN0_9GAMM|nr:FtsX-like permease family protein [Candidatus Endoriftia persephone]EGV52683.1 ABC-type transport system, involved in lipoprotein release, permease component [endosymbiont of Riftia pachyptila (vent Ph05)]EGW55711.1 ABC-type peptide transport system, involved in lipoprotein release, permease component [endosymbiont of Tevnia jerichonana (vent Tica)]USF86303.1 FtsX-like permease family protein [Candidatus Endoriftia persephone]
MLKRFKNILWLASRDYRNEWQMSSFFVLALAAVLGPMLVLFGLKFGIVGSMVDQLIDDPRNREIRPIGSGHYDRSWIETLRQRPQVAFIVPRTRSIAATLQLKSKNAPQIVTVEMIPTERGDPLLQSLDTPDTLRQLVLSESAARKLKVKKGDTISGSLARRFRGKSERVHVDLTVVDIARAGAFGRDGAFAPVYLLESMEDFRDGHAVPALGWSGNQSNPDQRTYPGFRLYARSIYDVEPLSNSFQSQGIEVRTRAADIEIVRDMDKNLSLVFWLIAVIGLVGFAFSLSASLWANVDRKRKELSVLRLVGFRTGDIVWFPMLQSIFTALLGWLSAVLIYFGVAWLINDRFAPQMQNGESVCRLLPEHLLVALGITAGTAILASAIAGYRAARIEPSEGLREI